MLARSMPSANMSESKSRSRSRSPRRTPEKVEAANPFTADAAAELCLPLPDEVTQDLAMAADQDMTPEQAQKQAEFASWMAEMRAKNEQSEKKNKAIQISQKFIPAILGEEGQNIVVLREKTSCWIAVDQSRSGETGFSTVNIAADTDQKIEYCEQEIAKIICGSRENSTESSESTQKPTQHQQQVLVEKMELPSTLCALMTKDGGKILNKVKGQCKADFFIPSVNEPSKIVHISGTQPQIDDAKQILLKMLGSNGEFAKVSGLEFLVDDEMALKTHSNISTMTPGTVSSEQTATGCTPPPSMVRSSGGAAAAGGAPLTRVPSGMNYSMDAANLKSSPCGRWMDSFEVPKKYLGLFIGRKGDAIRKYREKGASLGMEIQIDQQDVATAGTVKVLGMHKESILQLKAEMTQNLFKAIAHLDAQEAAGNLLSERYLAQAKGVRPQKGHEIMARKHVMMQNLKGGGYGGKGIESSGWEAAWRNPDNWANGPMSPLQKTRSISAMPSNDLSWLTNHVAAPSTPGGSSTPGGNNHSNATTAWLADVLGSANSSSQSWDNNWSTSSTACSTPQNQQAPWTAQNSQPDVTSMLASLLGGQQ